jgi:hypothetical protein
MLDAAAMVDPALNHDHEARGHEFDHRQSPRGDLTSSLTSLEERSRRRDQDNRDLCDVIRGRDARGQIENWCKEHERLEQEQREERDYDYYDPYYDQPHRQRSPKGGAMQAESRLFPVT